MASGQLNPVLRLLRRIVAAPPEAASTDGQLLARFAHDHDQPAFAVLLQRHGPMVLGVCHRLLRDAHEAEDAFQATFLVLARKATSIRKHDSLASWLYGVAYRTALRARASLARQRVHERQVSAMHLPDPSVEAAWRELRPVIDQELDRLPDKYRSPIVLCYLEGKTNEEAAQQLGWTKGTVSGRLARARDLLRGRLARRGLALSGAALTGVVCEKAASAAVPAALADTTIKAAALFAVGNSAAGLIATPAAVLAEGVLRTMYTTKLKLIAVALLTVGAFGTGAGVIGQQAVAGKPGLGDSVALVPVPEKKAEEPKQDENPAKLKEELARLKAELQKLNAEIEAVRAQEQNQRKRAELALREAEVARAEAERARQQALAERDRATAEAQRARELAQQALQQEARARQQEEEARRAAQRAADNAAAAAKAADPKASANNLKEIALAMHNYHDKHGHLPSAAIAAKDGKPTLSWRVALLPFLGEENLYKQFKLDEPWDSEHNKKLLAQMPKVFAPVGVKTKVENGTFYQGFTGKGTMFDGARGMRFTDVTDGTSNTILVVEAGEAVPWTKPEDLPYDEKKELPKLGGLMEGSFNMVLVDGSVHPVKKGFNEKILRLMITRSGGEIINYDDLNK